MLEFEKYENQPSQKIWRKVTFHDEIIVDKSTELFARNINFYFEF